MKVYDLLVVGGGVAGMSAACAYYEIHPERKILLVEREKKLGGILLQCFHAGFGIDENHRYKTGPEYAEKMVKELTDTKTEIWCNAELTEIMLPEKSSDESLSEKNTEKLPIARIAGGDRWNEVAFRKMILASGCYERPVGNLKIAGTRPEGIFTAGEMQRRINLEGYHPEGSAVIIGSGDIALIVARRLYLNGVQIKKIVEIAGESPALERNKRQCLEKYQLSLQTSSRVTEIHGADFLEGVTIEELMTNKTERISCNYLIIAAGLIEDCSLIEDLPENWKEWIVPFGNCEKIYPIADSIKNSAKEKVKKSVL